MANLKGGLGINGSYDKNVKDAFHRLAAFKQGRYGKNDHLTHSDGLATKREMYLNDYKNFAEENGFADKLNQTMTNENVSSFINARVEGLASSTQENYVRGFSSMMQGLREVNITVPVDKSVFDNKVSEIKANATNEFKTGRAIDNTSSVFSNLYEKRFESGVLAEVQNLGFRISETFEIVKNLESYYNDATGTIENLTGKGNHPYLSKEISSETVAKIRECENIPSQNSYRNDLKDFGVEKSHNWRFTYAREQLESKILSGINYTEAMRQVSTELNHISAARTRYYLVRA